VDAIDAQAFLACQLPLRELESPGEGEVHLWFLDLVRLGSPLQPDEAIDANRFTPRLQRTLRRFYLRLLLGAYLGMPGKDVAISRQIKGKPVLDAGRHASTLDFSMAASSGCCLIGLSDSGRVGVDLELRERRAEAPLALAARYFSNAETAALGRIGAGRLDQAFLHTWACKEAVVKALGHGIANQLCRFTVRVSPTEAPGVVSMEDDDADAWRLCMVYPGPRHMGAVAMRNERLKISGFSLEPPP